MRLLTNGILVGLCLATTIFAAAVAPTPEPSTAILLGVGLAAVGVATWRKNRKK